MTSLSEFIQEKREKAGFSVSGLANRANIPIETLEDIESGKELFLSVTIRQRLAKILKCSPAEIKNYERSFEFDEISNDVIDDLKSRILRHETNLRCPICGEPLITRIAKMYDLDDNLVFQPKAHCVKCIFQIKD
ncbi:MAG: helix-turn-helix domain-containing protein [bacterium]|nr:helix-turn-helix domain-containing protein [bacterium]